MNAVLDLTAVFTALLAAPLCLGLARATAVYATGAGATPVLAGYWALGRDWRRPAVGGRAPAAFRFASGVSALALAALGEGAAVAPLALLLALGAGLTARPEALALAAVAAASASGAPALLAALALLLLVDPRAPVVAAFGMPRPESGGPRAALARAGAAAALATPPMLAARLCLDAPAEAALLLLPFAAIAGLFAGLLGATAPRFALAFAAAAILGAAL